MVSNFPFLVKNRRGVLSLTNIVSITIVWLFMHRMMNLRVSKAGLMTWLITWHLVI